MVESCQEKKELPANCFSVVLAWVYSKAPKEAEPILRRLIILIFADWVTHDIASSRSCLGLFAGVRLLPYPVVPSRVLLAVVAPLWLPWNVCSIGSIDLPYYRLFFDIGWVQAFAGTSTSFAIAHMNPHSSRAMAVTTTCLVFPLFHRRR